MKYIIEHLEPQLFEWCQVEYKNISKMVGKDNLIITNLQEEDINKLKDFAEVKTQSISEMNDKLDNKKTCILDPEGEKLLSPKDKDCVEYIVLGGILGNDPPKARTKEEITLQNTTRRNLGKEQFPTDNAVYVCKKILNGTPFEELEFQDELELELDEGESVILPFRYVIKNGKPMISSKIKEILIKEYSFEE